MTPQEAQQLRQIAQLRAAGYSDADIFGGMANVQAGGYGLLPYALDAAGIASSYNLGRGSLAQGQQQFGYNLMRDPYNVVAANQYYADQGGSPGLTDPTLGNVPRSPMSRYGDYIDSILFPPGESGVTGAAPQTVNPNVNPTGQSWIDAWRAYHPGQPDPVPGYGPTAQQWTSQPAQAASARQLGAQLPGMDSPQFSNTLKAGEVPGFSSLNEEDEGSLTPDQRAQWMGQIASTGRVSDPNAAYADFRRRYATRGLQSAGTSR
jgi:hypothetical protein